MKKSFPGLSRQLEILGIPVLVGCCMHPTMAYAERQVHLPGYSGNVADILPNIKNPLPSGISYKSGLASDPEQVGNTLTVRQDKERAVIHWGSFDIDKGYTVQFNQPSTSSKVLNRVTGDTPSKIYGNLNANGQVYVINQNGILFGPDAQINVHSLTASALNFKFEKALTDDVKDDIKPEDLIKFDQQFINLPSFSEKATESYALETRLSSSLTTVSNRGTIKAGNQGWIFLIGQEVENFGIIEAPSGYVGIFAVDQVDISQYDDEHGNSTNDFFILNQRYSGTADNRATGKILTDSGKSEMYGRVVNQAGLIRATTALEKNGQINLVASEKVLTAKGSETLTPVSPSNDRNVIDETTFKQGIITLTSGGSIIHNGKIEAPNGDVTLSAQDRVYVGDTGSIDVSGSWVALTAADRLVPVQLNSKELRDAFAYKNGPLKGETVLIDTVVGLDFADISGYLASMERTAQMMTTKGGTIQLEAKADNGEVIVQKGATLDFSGGGLIYAEGLYAETMVRIGRKIYNLQDVPANTPIDEILGSYSKLHERYNLTDTWQGFYYGGSSPYLTTLPSFIQGSDAGALWLNGRKIILDGTLNASVVRGIYQNLVGEDVDDVGNLKTIGRKVPRGGTLQVGGKDIGLCNILQDSYADAIVIGNDVTATTLSEDALLSDVNDSLRITELSADIINNAGLGTLNLYPNQNITINNDVTLSLQELGKFDFKSQQIALFGNIQAPSGTVNFQILDIEDNFTTPNITDRFIYLSNYIDVSGSRIDNSLLNKNKLKIQGIVFNTKTSSKELVNNGGSVSIIDKSTKKDDAIFFTENSFINIDGGYVVKSDNSIYGGNAGRIEIKADAVLTDGTITGLALEGFDGGDLTVHTRSISITPSDSSAQETLHNDDVLSDDPQYGLVVNDDQYVNSGLTHLTYKSIANITVFNGANLAPSSMRLAPPQASATGYNVEYVNKMTALIENFGSSSINLLAGEDILQNTSSEGKVTVHQGAHLAVATEGTITVKGTDAKLSGSLVAPGGEINLSATTGTLELDSALLDASGTTLPDLNSSLLQLGLSNHSVVGGGAISLSGHKVILSPDSTLNVSGSGSVTNHNRNLQGSVVETTEASAAGSVTISYSDSLAGSINSADNKPLGQIFGSSLFDWLTGGELTINSTNNDLNVDETLVKQWIDNGFDDLTLSTSKKIIFTESYFENDGIIEISPSRRLQLNFSAINGNDGQDIQLKSDWIQLTNIVHDAETDIDSSGIRTVTNDFELLPGDAQLIAEAKFIDLHGSLALSGIENTYLKSDNDIRLYDYKYKTEGWEGRLTTAGNLELKAAAIYPGMRYTSQEGENIHEVNPSSFLISAGYIEKEAFKGGTITILPQGENDGLNIYSAGGELTLHASNVEQYGVLAAPMGTITLTAEDTINLHPGSVVTTSAQGRILYGTLESGQWTVRDSYLGSNVAVTSAPDKKVSLSAKGAITHFEGAKIEASGGGTVFAYEFLPGYDGSNNPLPSKTNDRYVILADNSVNFPECKVIYLEGTNDLPAGHYTLLPAEYAFLPDAFIIEATGETMQPGQTGKSLLGFSVAAGYMSEYSITTASPLREGYIIRSASNDVLNEGKFDRAHEFTATDAGDISISAGSGNSLLAGSIIAEAITNGIGGSLSLAATRLFVGNVASLTNDYLAEYKPNLVFDVEELRNRGLRKLTLGNNSTASITFGADSSLQDVPVVDVLANDSITLEKGAQVNALATTDQQGILSLSTTTLHGATNSLLHASDGMDLTVDNFNNHGNTFLGTIQVDDHGSLVLQSTAIYLEGSSYTDNQYANGLHLTTDQQKAIENLDTIELHGTDNIMFLGNVALHTHGNLTLNTARIAPGDDNSTDATVSVDGTLTLKGTGNESNPSTGIDTTHHTINLSASNIIFNGTGDLLFDSFYSSDLSRTPSSIVFNSNNEINFKGTGKVITDLNSNQQVSFLASRFISNYQDDIIGNTNTFTLTLSDYSIDARQGNVHMTGRTSSSTSLIAMPGNLTVSGNNITLDHAIIDMPGGILSFEADGSLTLTDTDILATGSILHVPITVGNIKYDNTISTLGGYISLVANTGKISIDTNSTIDSHTDSDVGGGTVNLAAINGGIDIELGGKIIGNQLYYDTLQLDGSADKVTSFNALAQIIATSANNNFSQLIDLQARTGKVNIDYDITTSQFILTADKGAVDIAATIDASGNDGGKVEIWADQKITLHQGGHINAEGKAPNGDGDGGSVLLASAEATQGGIQTKTGSTINVAGGQDGTNGSVSFRLPEEILKSYTTTDGAWLQGTIDGSAQTIAREFRVKKDVASVNSLFTYFDNTWRTTTWNALLSKWKDAGYQTAKTSSGTPVTVTLVPELELQSKGDMTLGGIADRPTTPGVLTFRAYGDLKVTSDIIDAPHTLAKSGTDRDSWDFNFIAGADLNSSHITEVRPHNLLKDLNKDGILDGNFTIGSSAAGKLVYSESGDINFAAANDVTIYYSSGKRGYMNGTSFYNLASFDGNITGFTGNNLNLVGGIIQTATSDIHLNIGNNLNVNSVYIDEYTTLYGAIRTTGVNATKEDNYIEDIKIINDFSDYKFNTDFTIDNIEATEYLSWAPDVRDELIQYMYWLRKDGGNIFIETKNTVSSKLSQPEGFDWDFEYTDTWITRVDQIMQVSNKIAAITKNEKNLSESGNNELISLKNYFLDLVNYESVTYTNLNEKYGNKYVESYTPSRYGAYFEASNDYFMDSNYGKSMNYGIATMAGGDIDIHTKTMDGQAGSFGGGDLTITSHTNLSGRFLATDGTMSLTAQGNFGNTSDDRSTDGQRNDQGRDTLIELGSGSLTIQSLGAVALGSITNPVFTTLVNSWDLTYSEASSSTITSLLGNAYFSGNYDFKTGNEKTTATFRYTLLPGALDITAGNDILFSLSNGSPFIMAPTAQGELSLIAGRDIDGTNSTGYSTYTNSAIFMSAADPANVYGHQKAHLNRDENTFKYGTSSKNPLHYIDTTSQTPTKTADPNRVYAGHNILSLSINVPKKTEIIAGEDIQEINYWGVNTNSDDLSFIIAGNDIIQRSSTGLNTTNNTVISSPVGHIGIRQSGLGTLFVQAGGNIDLGNTEGILSTGNILDSNGLYHYESIFSHSNPNQYQFFEGAEIIVLAGLSFNQLSDSDIDNIYNLSIEYGIGNDPYIIKYLDNLESFNTYNQETLNTNNELDNRKASNAYISLINSYFEALVKYGNKYNEQKAIADASGKPEDYNEQVNIKNEIQSILINPLFAGDSTLSEVNTGNIYMTQSSIMTQSGTDSIYIAAAGDLDTGTTVLTDNSTSQEEANKLASTGIATLHGGGISIFTKGDINVNESRIVTYFGNDIFMLSEDGDINAGRGSKSSFISRDPDSLPLNGKRTEVAVAPTPGSGIRALSIDPDGSGSLEAPEQGNVTLISFNGVIDAGEAGIAAKIVSLAAEKVLNSENISFSDAGVGVPTTADAGPSLNALTGSTTVSDTQSATQSIGQQVTDSGKKLAESVSKMAEDLTIKMLVFKFEGFGGDSGSTTE